MSIEEAEDGPDLSEGVRGDMARKIKKIVKENAKKLEELIDVFDEEVTSISKKTNDNASILQNKLELEQLRRSVKVVDITDPEQNRGVKRLETIKLTNRFITQLKMLRTAVPTRGRGKTTGSRIDPLRLHQVAVDDKIFSERTIETSGNNNKVEIILLVDASGSMGQYSGMGCTLYEATTSVTHKVFKALVTANVPTQAFGHTSYDSGYKCLIFKIVDSLSKNIDHRFELANGHYLSENLDGIAIEHIVKTQFHSDSKTKKILIVLSDGAPSAPSYSRKVGIPHTKLAIANARKAGVVVYSLSLTKSVVENNNEFYGKNFNIDASEDLDAGMTSLITQMVRRR